MGHVQASVVRGYGHSEADVQRVQGTVVRRDAARAGGSRSISFVPQTLDWYSPSVYVTLKTTDG